MSPWQRTTLGRLIEIRHGFAFKGEHITDKDTGDLLLTPGNFSVGGGFQYKRLKFYAGAVPDAYVLNAGEVIVTMTDLSKEADTLGYSAIVPPSEKRMLHNQRIGRAVAKSADICMPFIHWVMRTPDYRNEILANYTGSTVKHTSPNKILAYSFDMPSLGEQRAISAVLDALDAKIELNRKTAATLEEMARTLYCSWFVDFDPVRARAEGRVPAHMDAATAALFPDSFGEDGLPTGWKMKSYSDLIEILSGGTPKTSEPRFWGGSIPWYSVVDAPTAGQIFVHTTEKTITAEGLQNSPARIVPCGTTLLSARGTVGKLAMAPFDMTFNQSCYGLRGRNKQLIAFTYFATFWSVDQLKAMAHGSVFSTITRQTFEGIELPSAPSLILDAFEEQAECWLSQIDRLGRESRTLADLRDTLLPRLMSGELRVGSARELIEDAA